MKALGNYKCEGQLSIFDVYSPDLWSGKTSPERSVVTKARTSDASLKRQQKSQKKMPLYLDLRVGQSGHQAAASWEMGGLLLGEYMMHSFGECPSEERGSLLSQILEETPHQKYCLSEKACQGILRRADRRGKELPPLLKDTLLRQSVSKNVPDVRGGARESSSNTSEQEPCQHLTTKVYCLQGNGIDRADTAGCNGKGWRENQSYTLNTIDRPAVLSVDEKMGQTYIGENVGNTLGARDYKQPQAVCTYQKTTGALTPGAHPGSYNGQDAYNDMLIVGGSTEREPITASKASFFLNARSNGKADTLVATDYKDPQMICYGLDRASFNQGQNALYDFSVEEELAQPLIARGPGGVLTKQ